MKEIKIALLSNVNMDLIKPCLEDRLSEMGRKASIYVSGFNQYRQEILNPASAYYSFAPQFTLVFLDSENLFEPLMPALLDSGADEKRLFASSLVDDLKGILEKASPRLKDHYFLINNIPSSLRTTLLALDANTSVSLNDALKHYNLQLASSLREKTGVVTLDFDQIVMRWGTERIYDQRLWYLGRMRLSKEGLEILAGSYCDTIRTLLGGSKKCLVLDLDGTLWGGIVGEDGKENLELGEEGIGLAYKDFQKELLNLYKKGVLLAVCSKNNPNDALDVMRTHTHMVLREKHFASMKIDWSPKSDNIRAISRDLNIGLDTFVFLDNDPRERQQVRQYCGEVEVPDFPDDPSRLKSFILDIEERLFGRVSLTKEDRDKSEQYHAQLKRDVLKKQSGSLEEFYVSLKMRAAIQKADRSNMPRISQLTQKTNQFNLTTKRYTVAQIEGMAQDPSFRIWALSLSDIFGDNGIIGVLIAKVEGSGEAMIDTFLLSCRVIGKTAEDMFMGWALKKLSAEGVIKIRADYIPAEKNILVKDLYERLGFEIVSEGKLGEKSYKIDLSQKTVRIPGWFIIEAL